MTKQQEQAIARVCAHECLQQELIEALIEAYEAMNYMGDVLNGMDAVTGEDVQKTGPAFDKVRAVLVKARVERAA